jgi:hypothetical protein
MVRFRKSTRANKKYDAILDDGTIVPFGDSRYEQFHDRIGLYSHLDHNDPQRRANYRARHGAQGHHLKKNSPAYFSWNYLW